jgi:hypothetical protein
MTEEMFPTPTTIPVKKKYVTGIWWKTSFQKPNRGGGSGSNKSKRMRQSIRKGPPA